MANPEHLKILKQGVAVWNLWRKENPGVRASLQEADLKGAALSGANLRDADLRFADLRGADFRDGDLRRADFRETDLRRVRMDSADLQNIDLQGAKIRGASFWYADLRHSDLRNANLEGVSFFSTYLEGAKFGGALLAFTSINQVDLSQANGLGSVQHTFPSGISSSTLERTASGLSRDLSRRGEVDAFFRGAGVSEAFLDAFALLIESPIEFFSTFISYSHADKSIARRIYAALQARGIRCWLDEHDMKPGDRILDVVNDAIRLHDKILLCCSETSLNSWWVKDEIRKAMERERRDGRDIIIPLLVDRHLLDGWEDGLAADLRSRLAADFTGWEHDNAKFEEQFERVVRALRTGEGKREKAPEPKA